MERGLVSVIAATVVVGAVVASCGSPSDDAVPDETLPEVTNADGVSPLASALGQVAAAPSFRTTVAIGMTLSGDGLSIDFEPDLAAPMMSVDVDADGERYLFSNMSALFDAMGEASGFDFGEIFGDDLSMQTWTDDETMIVDLGGFASIFEAAELPAPFPADEFSVDLARIADEDGADAATAITGQAMPDPLELATVLAEALADADEVDADRYSGTLTVAEYSKIFGQDPDALAASFGVGAAGAPPTGTFEDLAIGVDVTLSEGAVDVVRFELDLSELMASMPDAQLDSLQATYLVDYEFDGTIEVTIPSGDFVDGTDAYRALLESL